MKKILVALILSLSLFGCAAGPLSDAAIMARFEAIETSQPEAFPRYDTARAKTDYLYEGVMFLSFAGLLTEADVPKLAPLIDPLHYLLSKAYVALMEDRMAEFNSIMTVIEQKQAAAMAYLNRVVKNYKASEAKEQERKNNTI